MFDHDLKAYIQQHSPHFLAYTNADYPYVSKLENFRGFHIGRDPRDICVSAYFSHLYSHPTTIWPELEHHRNESQKLSQHDGLLLEMEFRKKEFEEMYNWNYALPNVIELRMENVIEKPYDKFIDIFRFIGFLSDGDFTTKRQIAFLLIRIINKIHEKTKGVMPFHFTMKGIPTERLLGKIHQNRFSQSG